MYNTYLYSRCICRILTYLYYLYMYVYQPGIHLGEMEGPLPPRGIFVNTSYTPLAPYILESQKCPLATFSKYIRKLYMRILY